jgi:hypothetical protein
MKIAMRPRPDRTIATRRAVVRLSAERPSCMNRCWSTARGPRCVGPAEQSGSTSVPVRPAPDGCEDARGKHDHDGARNQGDH